MNISITIIKIFYKFKIIVYLRFIERQTENYFDDLKNENSDLVVYFDYRYIKFHEHKENIKLKKKLNIKKKILLNNYKI